MTQKITEYKIVRGPLAAFETQMAAALADGWQPYGPALLYFELEISFAQPIVK